MLSHLFWVDLEMSGLNVMKNKILEFACIITDPTLNQLIEGPSLIIHADKEELDSMDEWCTKQHKASGLYQQSLDSKITIGQAEDIILDFLKSKNIQPKTVPLAGNSIHMDRLFITFHMPRLTDFLHYRIVEVSTIKMLCSNWNPKVFKSVPQKGGSHRALDDIKESIEELKYYQQNFFKL